MPLSWSTKRQFSIFGISAVLALVAFFGFFFSPSAPSCFDEKQNQNEEGIDCGGLCDAACSDNLHDLTILWSRTLPAGSGIYDAVAFIENTNSDVGIERIAYRFKLYDRDNILVAERAGTTFVNPNERFMVFEGNLRVGNRIPKRAFFEFEKSPSWERVAGSPPPLDVRQTEFEEIDNDTTRLSAVVANRSFDALRNIIFTATLLDESGNVFAASQTQVETVPGDGEATLFFTWPRLFENKPARILVVPRVRAL